MVKNPNSFFLSFLTQIEYFLFTDSNTHFDPRCKYSKLRFEAIQLLIFILPKCLQELFSLLYLLLLFSSLIISLYPFLDKHVPCVSHKLLKIMICSNFLYFYSLYLSGQQYFSCDIGEFKISIKLSEVVQETI